MKTWLVRIAWKLRGRRAVRIQFANNEGAVDGIFLGVVAGHYKLANAYFYANRPNAEGEEMLGETWIPKDRVFLMNVKS